MAPTPQAADPPVTRSEFDKLMSRMVRTETKVMRLLEHFGLDGRGQPITEEQT